MAGAQAADERFCLRRIDGVGSADGQHEDIQILQGLRLRCIRHVPQIAQMGDGKAIAIDAHQQIFAPKRTLLFIMKGGDAADMRSADGMIADFADDGEAAGEGGEMIMIEMIVADQNGVTFLGAGRVGDAGIEGIGDQHGAIFIMQREAGMTMITDLHSACLL